LASWGEIAVGEARRSAMVPSRSAILGLVAAALGYDRNDDRKQLKLFKSLGFAVKLINGGSDFTDFHTAQPPKKSKGSIFYTRRDEVLSLPTSSNAIMSYRQYRCDAMSVIALWKRNDNELKLEDITQALKNPVYHLYLGRKSCPLAAPLQPQIIENDTLKSAFDQSKFEHVSLPYKDDTKSAYSEDRLFSPNQIFYYWDENTENGFPKWLQKTQRYDEPISRQRWQFKMRDEYMAVVKNGGV